ncbi:WYL domain-containing protein [Hominisplanchenecus murintestinalis]|uniref:WYL domain-containing protein n=1 Tax=Hominisplanchenecus murintestinalis TaxID=2941517 RepID=UPI001441D02B|nr:WYL domain-containing protein [Hominisplanchenecus murintestinalis]
MKLFDETENKYYELISYYVCRRESFTDSDVKRRMMEINANEMDVSVYDAIFSKEEGLGSIFTYDETSFQYVLEDVFPIRLNRIEREALFAVAEFAYSEGFINKKTIDRISKVANDGTGWSLDDIKIRNQDVRVKSGNLVKKISIIIEAIRTSRVLCYDNVKKGKYNYTGSKAWPVKLEYSFVNDSFRVCAYVPKEERFIKISLDTLENITIGEPFERDIEEEYSDFMKENTKKIILEVDPVQHIIERCFRLFSFYDRQAVYDTSKEKYRLELKYYRFDESEVIRDIMSLGSGAVVLEPRGIQMKIYNRIVAAYNNYKM